MKKKAEYYYIEKVDTRFGDNDIFGHLNNVVYYSLFDSVINKFLIKYLTLYLFILFIFSYLKLHYKIC